MARVLAALVLCLSCFLGRILSAGPPKANKVAASEDSKAAGKKLAALAEKGDPDAL